MKTSELINKLQILLDKHGDKELEFKVKDHYSIYGKEMYFDLKVGDSTNLPSDWCGCWVTDNYLRLDFNLSTLEGKYPKITFRKP